MAIRGEVIRGEDETETDAWRSVQAGLLAMALVGMTLATFGPYFNLLVGYLLLAGAGVVALLGLRWADRVAHARAPSASPVARRDARSGGILSACALIVALFYAGLLSLLVVFLPAVVVVCLVMWAAHRNRVDSEAAWREART